MALHSKQLVLVLGMLVCMQEEDMLEEGKLACTLEEGKQVCTLEADKLVCMVEGKRVCMLEAGKQVCTRVHMVVRKQEQYYRSTCQSNQPIEVPLRSKRASQLTSLVVFSLKTPFYSLG
jgi:hypothetical protein